MKTKIKLSNFSNGKFIFYKYIYPVLAKEFLFGNNYEIFANSVSELFDLDEDQWDEVLDEWETKETILKAD